MKYKPFFKKENNPWVGMGSCPWAYYKKKNKNRCAIKGGL